MGAPAACLVGRDGLGRLHDHGFVPTQNASPLVDHDGAARAVGAQAAPQGLATSISPAVGVEGIGLQIVQRVNQRGRRQA